MLRPVGEGWYFPSLLTLFIVLKNILFRRRLNFGHFFAIQILQRLDVTGLVKTSFMDCTCAFILFAIDECRKLKDGGPYNKIVITTTTLPDLLFRPVKGYSLGSV